MGDVLSVLVPSPGPQKGTEGREGYGTVPGMKKPKAAIIVLDGWGINENPDFNAVAHADTPFTRSLFKEFPHTRLNTSGLAVGLPEGQMGNSEVGHQNIGAGRILYQDFTRIEKAVEDGSFETNSEIQALLEHVKGHTGRLHLLGLCSDGGVHSHQRHALAIARAARKAGVQELYLHAFTDGRDTGPKEGGGFLHQLREGLHEVGLGRFASVSGRFYAMDRDKRWERLQKAYDVLVRGQGEVAEDPVKLLESRYQSGEVDEYIVPTVISGEGDGRILPGDGVFFFNFRADRARQLTRALINQDFTGFEVEELGLRFLTMTRYEQDLKVHLAFAPQTTEETLPQLVSQWGGKQLRAAETEKFAHVTFFFSCRREDPFEGEERLLIPSPKVRTYDLQPQMSAPELTEQFLVRTRDQDFDLIMLNFANGDMVGHTGMWDASLQALQAIDWSLSQIIPHLRDRGYTVFLTADHGNIELMQNPSTGEPFTEHTTLPVPLLCTDTSVRFRPEAGNLASIAPTVIHCMGWKKPLAMTGECLILPES
jgi:2,3-bisphosphoglycerate-independent phosphoglycerate mutase